MPIVPIAQPDQQVELQPLAGEHIPRRLGATPETFGGGAALRQPDLSGLRDMAVQVYQEQKRKADQVAVLRAAGQASELETNLAIHGRSQMGMNAFHAMDDVSEAWEKGIADIHKGLTNDDQRQAFMNVAQSHWNALNSTVQTHVAQQHRVVDDDATNGYVAGEANAALHADPTTTAGLHRIQEAIANSGAALRAHGERNGLPSDYIDAHVAENTSKLHVGTIDRLLANDQDVAAKGYYAQYKDQIEGQQLPAIDKALELGSSRADSQQRARQIMAKATTRSEALEAVDQIDNPKVQDMTRQRVEQLWTQKEDNLREQSAARMQRATDIVRQTRDFDRIPPSMLVGMSVQQQDALLSFAKKLNEGTPIKTDRGTYNYLEQVLSNPKTRDKALKIDLNDYTDKLSDGDFKHFSDMLGGLQKNDDATIEKADHVFTNNEIINRVIRGAGIGVGVTSPLTRKADAAATDRLTEVIGQQISTLEKNNKGRLATNQEVEDIAHAVVMQHLVETPGRLWGTNSANKRLDEMGPKDTLIIRAKDIPRNDYQAIVRQLQSQRLPVSDDAVVAAYKTYLLSLKPRGQ